jgi:hypothetical protein
LEDLEDGQRQPQSEEELAVFNFSWDQQKLKYRLLNIGIFLANMLIVLPPLPFAALKNILMIIERICPSNAPTFAQHNRCIHLHILACDLIYLFFWVALPRPTRFDSSCVASCIENHGRMLGIHYLWYGLDSYHDSPLSLFAGLVRPHENYDVDIPSTV